MTPKSDSTSVNLRTCRLSEGLGMTSTLLALSAVAAPLAHAQEPAADKKKTAADSTELPEMVVTADGKKLYKPEKVESPKYTKPLLDTPQTVTVIPREVIEEQGATTLTEILRNVPGITMAGGENGNGGTVAGDAFIMRGFDATSSLYVDGVRDLGTQSRDSFNTETVEAFLGPTGADVGRGNAAGYVNQATKTAHLGNAYLGSAQYASGDRQRYTVDLNQEIPFSGPLDWVKGTAFRLNSVYQDGGVPGRDNIERNIFGIAPTIAFGLGTDFRTFLSYQHTEQHNVPDYGIPANRNEVPDGVDRDWFYGTEYDFEDIQQDTFTARFEYDVNEDLTIRNQTRFNETSRASVGVRPAYTLSPGVNFGRITRTYVAGDRDNEIFSNQTSITYKADTGPFKHTLVGALEYTDEEQNSYTLVPRSSSSVTFPSIPVGQKPSDDTPAGFDGYHRNPDAIARGEAETVGVSIFDTIDITPKWLLTGGVRMDSYDVSYRSVSTANVPTPNPATTGKSFYETSDEVYSSKIGLTYKPVESGSIYIAYSKTVQPPGATNFTLNETESASGQPTSSSNLNTDPQESENYELGSKWDLFDKKLTITGAVFYTENTNFIYVVDPVGPVYSTDGGQKIRGATIGATGRITENWAVLGSVTNLNGEIDQEGNAIDGNELSRTPDWSASVWSTYKLPAGFTVGLGFRCQDSVNTSTVDDSPTMAGFGVFDGLVQYDVNEHLNFRLNVYNLLDKDYISGTSGGGGGDGGGTGGTTGGGVDVSGNRVTMGAPLSFALTANYKF